MKHTDGLKCMALHEANMRMHACSNANPGDFGGTDTPPWSPRRVPPAHLWGEGPPRYPGYRSGGALLPGAPEGNAHIIHHSASAGFRQLHSSDMMHAIGAIHSMPQDC